jgi:hypothetical protein
MMMTSRWEYQAGFDLNDSATAEWAGRKLPDPALAPPIDVLATHCSAEMPVL